MKQTMDWPGRIRSARLFIAGLLCLLPIMAVAQAAPLIPTAPGPSPAPRLRIETGMHTDGIEQMGVDAQGKYLVTCSHDKTVRVWDAATFAPLTVLRPPLGAGDEGQLNAVAISPDGQTIVCGGNTGYSWGNGECLYFFDRASGRMIKTVRGLAHAITYLKYSPDGKTLAVNLASAEGGVDLLDTRTYDYLPFDGETDYGASTYGTSFSPGPGPRKMATTCWDGYVRLYALGNGGTPAKLLTKRKISGYQRPTGIAFSPDGTHLAVGYNDSESVVVLSAQDLSTQYGVGGKQGEAVGGLERVCWSADGAFLYAAGTSNHPEPEAKSPNMFLFRAADAGRGKIEQAAVASQSISDLLPRVGGGVYISSGEPSLVAVDGSNEVVQSRHSDMADLRGETPKFQVSRNGFTIKFDYTIQGVAPTRYTLGSHRLTFNDSDPEYKAILTPPLTAAPGLALTDWDGSPKPLLNGKPLPMVKEDTARCVAIAPDHQTFLLGSQFALRLFAKDGTRRWVQEPPGIVWNVNVSGDGKVAVVALGDGTIRWYRLTDGQELAAFFPHGDVKLWVAWTPAGYYDCCPGGEDLIGWHINRGRDQAADFFPASRFRDTLYRPDVLAQVTTTLNGKEALRLADAAAGRKPHAADIAKQLPPVVSILSPDNGAAFTDNTVTVQYSVRTPSGDPVQSVRALVNGRPIPLPRRIELTADDTNTAQGATKSIDIALPAQDCTLSLVAYNKNGASEAATISLHRKGGSVAPVASDKPTLYVLAVGVGKYPDPAAIPTLTYPAKDAQDFAAIQTAQKGKLYTDVQVRLLTDEKATKDAILDGLDWIKAKTTKNDVAAIFLSGHGANDSEGRYIFIPINFDRARLARTGLSYLDIKSTIENIAGKTLFFVDSCHSGGIMGGERGRGADVVGAVNDLSSAENGAIVFTASTSSKFSLESAEWGNGAFTKAIVEGMNGLADFKKTHSVTVKGLDFYISDRVKELTHGEQLPTTSVPPNVPDYTVADTP